MVTGASRSIGKGIALELGAAGATVYVTGRTVEPGAMPGTIGETAAEIDALGGHGIAVACDHKDDAQVKALFDRVGAEQGHLDILVNNVFPAPVLAPWLGKKYWELPVEAWDEIIGVGTRSHYVASVYGTPLLFAAGGGLIVNVSSSGAITYAHNVVYGVGKAAVDKMTADMAVELEGTGVTRRVAVARASCAPRCSTPPPSATATRSTSSSPARAASTSPTPSRPASSAGPWSAMAGDPGPGRPVGQAVHLGRARPRARLHRHRRAHPRGAAPPRRLTRGRRPALPGTRTAGPTAERRGPQSPLPLRRTDPPTTGAGRPGTGPSTHTGGNHTNVSIWNLATDSAAPGWLAAVLVVGALRRRRLRQQWPQRLVAGDTGDGSTATTDGRRRRRPSAPWPARAARPRAGPRPLASPTSRASPTPPSPSGTATTPATRPRPVSTTRCPTRSRA